MTQEQLIDEIRRLPIERRVELLELISRSVREESRAFRAEEPPPAVAREGQKRREAVAAD